MFKWIFIITFLGLCFRPSHGVQPQFVLFQTPKTWYEAQSFCREQCFDLATINSMSEMETVLEVVKDKYNTSVWIGLMRGYNPTWHWSLAGKEFYKEGENNYFIWSTVNQGSCGSYRDGKLRMNFCGVTFYVVCFDRTKQGADQYVLITQNMIWIAAREYCRTHYTDLTSVRNDAESQMVQKAASGSEVWVGLFKDSWLWSDQSDSSFRYWNVSHSVPGGTYKCIGLVNTMSGKWDDLSCDNTYPFLCYCRKNLSIIKLRISPQDSETDLEDPLIQENILEQMNQWLKNMNVTDDAQLKWTERADGRVFMKEP